MSSLPLDLSQPISTLLREGTAAAHDAAENSEGAGYLTRGELDREEYVRFLIMLHRVYSTLEQALEQHASHPVLAPTYNPTLLARTSLLEADIAHLLSVPTSEVFSHSLWTSVETDTPPALSTYTARLRTLRDSPDPTPLLAHSYVRYLGDLSGGQFIRRRIEKAYGLESDAGAGTTFYDFRKLGDTSAHATLGDMKRIKEWFREGMDSGVADDRDRKVMVVAEANKAFEFNNGLFKALKPPSNPPSPPLLPTHALGDPTSPIETDSKAGLVLQDRPYPLQLPEQKKEAEDRGEGPYTMQGVLSFIFAMCLAHFILVVGGFTGTRGWEKYVAVMEWIARQREQIGF